MCVHAFNPPPPPKNFRTVLKDFHKIEYGHHSTRNSPVCVFNLLTICNTNINAMRNYEMGTKFMPLNVKFMLHLASEIDVRNGYAYFVRIIFI
jgi:hypothetical protein